MDCTVAAEQSRSVSLLSRTLLLLIVRDNYHNSLCTRINTYRISVRSAEEEEGGGGGVHLTLFRVQTMT